MTRAICDPDLPVQTTMHPSETPSPDSGTPPEARPCAECGTELRPDQDWCLSCGTAAAGRLGRRPGGRAVTAVAAVTLFLVLAAVLASYTALTGDANNEAGKAAGASATPIPGQVAQIPDGPAPPAAPTPPVATPPVTPPPTTPSTPSVATPPVVPATPAVPTPPVTPVVPVTPATPTTSTGSTTTGTTTGTTTSTSTTPAKVTLTPIKLAAKAAAKYDPSGRITASGDPAAAQDGNPKTSWSVTTPDDSFPMQVGLLINLGKAQNVKTIDLGTSTPGGRVEIYGAVGSAIPDDILDTRWEHVRSTSKVDANAKLGNKKGDGHEQIRLPGPGATGSRFRYVLLWFTTPPTKGPTVTVTDVSLQG